MLCESVREVSPCKSLQTPYKILHTRLFNMRSMQTIKNCLGFFGNLIFNYNCQNGTITLLILFKNSCFYCIAYMQLELSRSGIHSLTHLRYVSNNISEGQYTDKKRSSTMHYFPSEDHFI